MQRIIRFLQPAGLQGNAALAEKFLATLGGCLAMLCIAALSFHITGQQGAAAVVPSMGAPTVLLFAVPHGPLSQPWALFVGNGVSAMVGVTCAIFIPHILLAAALAVGLAIGAMHITRSIHPPGGATALAAVMGGQAVHDLGYWYVLVPTLLNCMIIFIFAVVFNGLFPWRRYPLARIKYHAVTPDQVQALNPELLKQSLQKHHLELSVERLLPAINEALLHTKQQAGHLAIELGGVYSNDKPGAEWAVRKIVDEHAHIDPEKDIVIYHILEGFHHRRTGSCRRYEFAQWAQKRLRPSQKEPTRV